MAETLTMDEQQFDGYAVLTLAGRFDASVAPDVKDRIRMLGAENNKGVILDMTGITFVDSSGLGVLVASLRTLKEKNVEFLIAGLSQKVRMVFELIKLHKVLKLYQDLPSAVASLNL